MTSPIIDKANRYIAQIDAAAASHKPDDVRAMHFPDQWMQCWDVIRASLLLARMHTNDKTDEVIDAMIIAGDANYAVTAGFVSVPESHERVYVKQHILHTLRLPGAVTL
ncbi:MAG: hypothetical protein JNL32_13185 [Candidatus Kapabacteria bacterium]|nr:hypothetical protein [Candidatus Kapabacteria bacterium]